MERMSTLAEAIRDMLTADPHVAAAITARSQMRAASAAEERASRRRFERTMLGCCPCGEAPGEDECPWCDGGLPLGLRAAGAAMRRRANAVGTIDAREALAKLADLRPRPKAESAGATRALNRHERRRARSRRWRG
jgi:hypothetical protein